ncbi:MAG: sigma-70 family RNA polymerase sigma factor [Planctomycetaceae bacterium]|nr:sigma-70 family RNA polymerase sigma factor [Planctomycetaceae bacterium]
MANVTQILQKNESGYPSVAEQLLPLVYDELRKLAAMKMANERPDHSLEATALVHEAYIRLVNAENVPLWESRGHFFNAAAEAMRRTLVDRARQQKRQKRGAGARRLTLEDNHWVSSTTPEQILSVNDAIERLGSEDPTAAEVVKLRFFAGMSVAEAADALGIHRGTAARHWSYARAWIRADLLAGEPIAR